MSDPKIVLVVAVAMFVVSVSSLTTRIVVGIKVDVAGTVLDSRTHKPVSGAHVNAMGIHQVADGKGAFLVTSVRKGTMLRVSADNFTHFDVAADDAPVSVSLKPIPVTGKVTSAFTSKGIGASVRGKEVAKTRADGTFTTYGVGPGDTLTISAFGHAPKKVKIGPNRKVSTSLALGRIDPNALLRPVKGYGYVDTPPALGSEMLAMIAQTDPAARTAVTGVSAKSVVKDGKPFAFAIAFALDPKYAALPGVRKAFFDGFTQGAGSKRDMTIGDYAVREGSGDGLNGYAWQRFAGFVIVLGEPKADVERFVRTLLLGDNATA